ncbi:diguanylate cyclase domain-containing protein [Companilactobacillus halodurans]|uniref:Diguanylate cyclase n=1 Tax=Companilactobacillus halodurans TaxID=2584183 RepID=A0A5P0ZTY6_9LACO|nr:diguanylate cyclase [Companilactobacillus halodurans]MQS75578.1 diguanylate cyclase [Companilactobacillus halodurans]MQS96292.1 diguanylate cyclase [Companilactobacillus halodurans]
MENHDAKNSLYEDIGLLLFLTLFSAAAILMVLSGNILLNVIYLFCTILLLMITYFFGILPSLIANIIFICIQVVIMVYQYVTSITHIPWQLSFWMLIPILMSLALYSMTQNQVALQKANRELRTTLVERGAFDEQTNLRTTVAYIEDIAVFAETNRRFKIPVATAIIKIRYFNDLKRMMSAQQLRQLLQLTSDAIKEKTRNNDITYLLDNEDPTWAILLYTDDKGADIATKRIEEGFEKRLEEDSSLNNLAISMKVGIALWNGETMKTPYDLMNEGIHETQYDV